MRPGEWLEIENYQIEKAHQIFARSTVQALILKENNLGSMIPQHPFYLKIFTYQEIESSTLRDSPFFKGFIWSAHDGTDFEKLTAYGRFTHDRDGKYDLWVDFEAKKYKPSLKKIREIPYDLIRGFYCGPHQKMPLREFHKLLMQLPPEINLVRSINRPHEIADELFTDWDKLEMIADPVYQNLIPTKPQFSVVIPHFETPYFTCNVMRHLQAAQRVANEPIEILVIDDSSSLETFNYLCSFAKRNLKDVSLKLFRWPEAYKMTSGQRVFRAGASRNWGAQYAQSRHLLFLDSDMLVPQNIFTELKTTFEFADIIQFVRKHVPSEHSSEFVNYDELVNKDFLYIEEAKYWQKFFSANVWMDLEDHWKFTCTYGLAIERNLFFNIGRFRRNFIRYGFEDTDLGFRLAILNKRFVLNKNPLLHLSNKKDSSQSWLYRMDKTERLKPMARAFYSLNYNQNLYPKFQGLFD